LQLGDFTDALNSEVQLSSETQHLCDTTSNSISNLHILRVGTDGSSSDVIAYQWPYTDTVVYTVSSTYSYTPTAPPPYIFSEETKSGSLPILGYPNATSITNADQGAMVSWRLADLANLQYCADTKVTYYFIYNNAPPTGPVSTCITPATLPNENHLTTMNESGGISDVVWQDAVAGQNTAVQPVLQFADGSYVGSVSDISGNGDMVAFDASGSVKWTVPRYGPDIATADGGIVADTGLSSNGYKQQGTTFDASGNATGQLASLATQSWLGNEYQGFISQVSAIPSGLRTNLYCTGREQSVQHRDRHQGKSISTAEELHSA
jgi:hypothetical protein